MTQTARIYQFPAVTHNEGRHASAHRRSPLRRTAASARRWIVSHKATDWAWEQPVRGVRQHVLLALAERANPKTGQCTPSLAELSRRTGLGESTIRGHIRALELAGMVKVDVTNGGRRQRSTYTLAIGTTFPPSAETPQELGGFEGQKPPRSGRVKPSNTPQELGGIEAETPQELATNPPGAGGVVLRTNTSKREPGSTCDADASPGSALFAIETTPKVTPGAVAVRGITGADAVRAWCDAYAETHDAKPTKARCGQVGREAAALIAAGNPPERVLVAARSAGARGFATVQREYDQLAARSARSGQPPRLATTDARVQAGLALAAKYDHQEAG